MGDCVVCGGDDFVEQDGLFYCSECNTRNEDARIEVFEEKFEGDCGSSQPSQWLVSSHIKEEREDEISNIKILTSWETFNICLRGLVNQLRNLGATPKFEAMVFKMWSEYLQKTDAAFFSMKKKPPKLPKHAWTSDAFLVYNIQKHSMSVEDIVGKKQKGRKRSSAEVNLDEDTNADEEPATKNWSRGKSKRKFFTKAYEENQPSTPSNINDTTQISSLNYKSETEVTEVPKQILSNEDNPEMVPLRRKHLLAFIYLGMLVTQQEIQLSDLLRWIDEGHVHYHQLNKFFMPGVAVLDDLKEYFVEKKTTPKYSDISRLTRNLARFLSIRNILPADVNRLVHKFCNEFNLPNQIALVSRRLIQLLPIRGQDPEAYITITSWETRAMAQIIVTLKILLGLDDSSEHRNSKIAKQISELLSHGGSTIEPFIWDDWVRWHALRSIALLLHGKTTTVNPNNTGLYQNIDSLVSVWGNYVSSANVVTLAKRQKMETELMSDLIRCLDWDSLSFEGHSIHYPATTTPLAAYTDAVINELQEGRLPCSDDSWNALVRNIDFEELRRDFRCKSIEYLLHPERYIEWAQQKGLPVGLRNGGAFRKTFKPAKATAPRDSYLRSNIKWRVSLTKRNKKKGQKEVQNSGAKSVVLPVTTKPDNTGGRPLEPLQDLTDHVPYVRVTLKPKLPPPAASMPLPEEEDQYLHVPSTEYYTHSRKAQEAPISFRYLVETAARYLHISKTDLLEEITVVEDIHKNFLDFSAGKITEDSSQVIALKK